MNSEAWCNCKLGELLQIKHGFAFKGEFFADTGDLVLLTPGNFREDGGLKLKGDREKYYRGSFPDEFLLRRGDLLIAMTDLMQNAPILGSPTFIPVDGRYLHNQRLGKVVNVRIDKLSPEFLYYLFNTGSVRGQIKGSATGSTVRHTSPSRIGDVAVRIPPLRLQRRIASALSAYDELIENCQRRIQILETIARALYREWFVEFRFPGHEPSRRTSGDEKHEWVTARVSDVAAINRAQISARSAPEEIHYIDIASVSPGRIETVSTYAVANAPGRARRIVQHGDVIWSCVRPNRRSYALVMHPAPNTIASTGFAVLSALTVPVSYLYLSTTTDAFVAYLTNHATGAAYPAVTATTFEDAELPLPPQDLLARFDEVARPMLEQTSVLQRQIENLRTTRDLLLPRLLSGQLALAETEAAVP